MTQDELIVKIKHDHAIKKTYWIAQALRAIVELHRPVYREHYANRNLEGCSICNDWWPCLTIEAIEKELND